MGVQHRDENCGLLCEPTKSPTPVDERPKCRDEDETSPNERPTNWRELAGILVLGKTFGRVSMPVRIRYFLSGSLLAAQASKFRPCIKPNEASRQQPFPLVNQLEGSRTTLFFFQAVEESCWWLPGLRLGRNCFGSCALRRSEFITSLGRIMDEIQADSPSLAEHKPRAASAPRTSMAALSGSNTISVVPMPVRARGVELLKRRAV